MPIPTVGTIIFKNNKVLLVRHGDAAGFETNTYGLPSGRVNQGEAEKDTAIRELEEETGLITSLDSLIEFKENTFTAKLPRKNGEVIECFWRVYICENYVGKLKSSAETTPEWVEIDIIKDKNLIVNVSNAIENALRFLNEK